MITLKLHVGQLNNTMIATGRRIPWWPWECISNPAEANDQPWASWPWILPPHPHWSHTSCQLLPPGTEGSGASKAGHSWGTRGCSDGQCWPKGSPRWRVDITWNLPSFPLSCTWRQTSLTLFHHLPLLVFLRGQHPTESQARLILSWHPPPRRHRLTNS